MKEKTGRLKLTIRSGLQDLNFRGNTEGQIYVSMTIKRTVWVCEDRDCLENSCLGEKKVSKDIRSGYISSEVFILGLVVWVSEVWVLINEQLRSL